ncbi:MAG: ribonuclease P protein component [Rickettsiaceae bacterium]|nr:ribonuclease P protein component [Rickettsiaceae bacterium]
MPKVTLTSLKLQRDFDFFKQSARKVVSKFFVIIFLKKSLLTQTSFPSDLLYAIKVTKKIGCAAVRNKIKRRIRHILKITSLDLSNMNDLAYIIIARSNKIASLDFIQISEDFSFAAKKCL